MKGEFSPFGNKALNLTTILALMILVIRRDVVIHLYFMFSFPTRWSGENEYVLHWYFIMNLLNDSV